MKIVVIIEFGVFLVKIVNIIIDVYINNYLEVKFEMIVKVMLFLIDSLEGFKVKLDIVEKNFV